MPDRDGLNEKLERLAAEVTPRARLLPAAELRRRADRRRATTVVAASLATVGVVLGAWGVTVDGEGRAVAPADPSTSTTTAATTSPESANPTESAPTSLPDKSPRGGWITTLPAAFALPHEHVWDADESSGWRLLPCLDQQGYPSDRRRTDWREVSTSEPEATWAEQIAVFESAADAEVALADMRQALADCAEQRDEAENGDVYEYFWEAKDSDGDAVEAGQDAPDQAFQAWNWYRMYDQNGNETARLGGEYFTLARVGNAVFLTMDSGESDWGEPGAAERSSATEAKTLRGFLPKLCTFADRDGC